VALQGLGTIVVVLVLAIVLVIEVAEGRLI
jgi:hypothetical protein